MSKRESRTVSVQVGDWDRWTRAAGERGIAERGRAYSVSEFIRKAVETHMVGSGTATGEAKRMERATWAGAEADDTPIRLPDEAAALAEAASMDLRTPLRRPYTKQRQTGKGDK